MILLNSRVKSAHFIVIFVVDHMSVAHHKVMKVFPRSPVARRQLIFEG